MDQHVRTHGPGLRGELTLAHEVAVLDHPGELHEATQADLAPLAAYFRTAQRAHEVAGLRGKRELTGCHRLELRRDAAVGLAAGFIELLELRLRAR